MWWIEELQVHPMKLFMYLIALDGAILLQYGISFGICPFELYELLAWTLFFENTCESQLRALSVLRYANEFIVTFVP